ncbi:16S rRNA (cytosine(967)-C(5))-methyltransferase RsmB [Fructilactobacillus myrtifloralis]|uniref:16S rRNA (cytosine(967)-C(5))-methyltransferase n=1 Tax=Fructilactobacillus myrtifloralis TaxID=2940301 RepID=A0ABY5BSQ9_9LACO|nr:16S rRNA (cytosine(967)-C(5))-methyltransferase RsmB [Fructilactobacillus myrtifloralis]USS85293.1 16S rRNA (cytosine(967)-C(5))-methyltransferase RsmB [Fructilactobacillus myrtifloralis]
MTTNKSNPRALAVETLERVQNGAYSNLQINNVITTSTMSEKDVRLFTNIVYGVIQHKLTLNYYVDQLVQHTDKLQPWVLALLDSALYQMIYLDKVPNRAIFDESIKIAKQRGHDGIRRLVTGVLHTVGRRGLPDLNQIQDPEQRLVIETSTPQWLVEALQAQLGNDRTNHLLATINQPAHQSIRVNRHKTTPNELQEKLEAAGFTVRPSTVAADALVVSHGVAAQSELFQAGLYTIQDESAMLPVQALPLTGSELVLDACAAPGGKTTQLAEQLTSGRVIALDLHAKKLRKIHENAERLGVADRIETQALDARRVDEVFADQTFDHILVDAPCSGLGLVRRKPEIRYEKSMADVRHLATIQQAILTAVAPKVKVGGTLMYSTCTILNQENRENVSAFLATHPNFEPVVVPTAHQLKPDRATPDLAIYPDDYASDGFFIAGFRKGSE